MEKSLDNFKCISGDVSITFCPIQMYSKCQLDSHLSALMVKPKCTIQSTPPSVQSEIPPREKQGRTLPELAA